MSKDKRKKELEKEIQRLQKKLGKLDDDEELIISDEEEDFIDDNFMDDFDPFDKKLKGRPPRPARPPMPPMPPHPARVVRIKDPRAREGTRTISFSDMDPEQRKEFKKQQELIRKEKVKMREQLSKMKEELKDRKEEYAKIRKELRDQEHQIRDQERKLRAQAYQRGYQYSWDTDVDADIEVLTDDLEMRLGDYTRSILSSVAESLKSSMGLAIKGATDIGKEMKDVGEELGKVGKEIGDKISKDIYVSVGPNIPEDKLEEFYEIGAAIVAAIGDPNRLRILKELEKSPKYQKELSDITNLRGGTFKHHMDRLLDDEVKFVTQEVVRGRYLLTTRGREALKLAEMQYMRYLEEKKRMNGQPSKKASDSEEEYDVDIK